MLEFRNVSFTYRGQSQPVLADVSFRLPPGRLAFLTGASGAGKTTLLRLIYRSLEPRRGTIFLDGQPLSRQPVPRVRRRIGVVFQANRLLLRKTALENIVFAGEVQGQSPWVLRDRAYQLCRLVGLEGKEHRRPHDLSAGEQQRVAIARALIGMPKLLLADEPTGNLDMDNARQVLHLLGRLNRDTGASCLIATHALHLIDEVGGDVFHVADGRLARRGEE